MIPYEQLKKMARDKWNDRPMTKEQALATADKLHDELEAKEAEFEAVKEDFKKLSNPSDLLDAWGEPFQKANDLQQMFIRYLFRKEPRLDGLLAEYFAAWIEEVQTIRTAHHLVDDDGLPPIDMQFEERAREALPELHAKNNECISFFIKNQERVTDERFRVFMAEWLPHYVESWEAAGTLWEQYMRSVDMQRANQEKTDALLDDVSFRRLELTHFAHLHGMDRAEVEKRAKQRKGPAV